MTNNTEKNSDNRKMRITVQGHKIVLLFAERPNPEIAVRVKQALLGTYALSKS